MCDEVGKSILAEGTACVKALGWEQEQPDGWCGWKGVTLGQSEGNEVGGVNVTWGLMGLGGTVGFILHDEEGFEPVDHRV